MNLVLLRQEELEPGNRVTLGDGRARHILSVLKAGPGATVRVGLLDGPLGLATVERVEGERVVLSCAFEGDPPEAPRLDLLLALPRPKVLNRLWSQLAALGVGRIVLTNAARVECCYFASHVLSPEVFTPLLLAYDPGSPYRDLSVDTRDNTRVVPKCIVVDDRFDWRGDSPPGIAFEELIV